MKISVTEQHIKRGESRSCRNCAVALAVNEVAPGPGPWTVGISAGQAYAFKPGNHRVRLPDSVFRFILKFDGMTVLTAKPVPFEFEADFSGPSPVTQQRAMLAEVAK